MLDDGYERCCPYFFREVKPFVAIGAMKKLAKAAGRSVGQVIGREILLKDSVEGLRNSLEGVVKFVLYGFHFLRAFVFESIFHPSNSLCEFSFGKIASQAPQPYSRSYKVRPLEWLLQVFDDFAKAYGFVMQCTGIYASSEI